MLLEVPATEEGLLIEWDASRSQPTTTSLRQLRQFMAVLRRAERKLENL